MLLFIDFCELWWLAWLLPFLLGLLLGWLLWSKFKSLLAASEDKVASLNSANSKLEADLTSTRNKKADLEGDVALMKGRVREMEAEVGDYKTKLSAAGGNANVKVDTSELDGLRGKLKTADATIADLNTKLADCEAKGKRLMAEKASWETSANADKGSAGDAAVSALAASGATALSGSGSGTGSDSGSGSGSGSGSSTSSGAGSGSSGSSKSNPYAKLKSDNLQIIEGVGPKMESVLHENGVKSWSDLAGKSEADLRAILDKYGDKYRIIDPSSWSAQASKAAAGDWDGLISLQKALDGGKGDTGNNQTDSKLEKLMVKMGLLRRYKQDDLKAVEGVGPKIAELLNNGGITTWRKLANTDVATIQGILDAAGSRYKLADPGSWPKQAELAADGKWDELTEYQDRLQGGK